MVQTEVVKPKCFGHLPPYEQRGIACAVCDSRVFANCALESMKEYFGKKGIEMKKEVVANGS